MPREKGPYLSGISWKDALTSDVRDMTVAAAALMRDGEKDRSLTCLVCGKSFPRGGVDLERHSSAKTLNHWVTTKKMSPRFLLQCTCGIWFCCEEHIQLHRLNICMDTGPHEKILPIPVDTSSGKKKATGKSGTPKEIFSEPQQILDGKNEMKGGIGRLVGRTPDKIGGGGSGRSHNMSEDQQRHVHKLVAQERNFKPTFQERGVKRGLEDAREPNHGVGKRMKLVMPEDRKAFFAVTSLLVNPNIALKAVTITTTNFDDFIPVKHRTLLYRLKEKLNWR